MIVQELMFESYYDLNEAMCNFNKAFLTENWVDRSLKKKMNKAFTVLLSTIEKLEKEA